MSSSIKMIISKDGKIKIEGIKGVFGPSCEKITENLERQGKVISKKKTSEYDMDDPKSSISTRIV